MLSLLLAAAMQASAAPPPAALPPAVLEIRFCPADAIHSHPLAPLRQVDSLFVQNVAVINRGETPVTIGAIEIALFREGAVSDTRHIEGNSLAAAASRGQAIHSGMNAVVPGQFCDGALLGGADVAASPALAP
ncbi:MAG: hypothetical protein H7X93_05940, partial [Sphingomonadaceae bacterium]|nr:hypothetical protein [Sphingomonadaceae bacterium]